MIDLSLLQDFIPEAMEHLEEMESNLVRLESEPENRQVLDNIFRSAHTIKGSSEYMGMKKIAGLAHKMESLLDVLRSAGMAVDRSIIDVLIASRDRIVMIIGELEARNEEISDTSDLIARVEQCLEAHLIDRPGKRPAPVTGAGHDTKATAAKKADAGIFSDEMLRKLVSGFKSALFEAISRGITEARKNEILERMEELLRSDAVRENAVLSQALSGMRKNIGMMVYPDDAGDILASLHDLLAHFTSMGVEEDPEAEMAIDPPDSDSVEASIIEVADAFFDDVTEDGTESGEDATSVQLPEPSVASPARSDEGADSQEIYEEEYDEELFGIFIDHLKESFEKLNQHVMLASEAGDPGMIIGLCLETVGGLQSSASYMDYKKLIALYADLKRDLEKASESAETGEPVDLEFIRPCLRKVARRFPGYEKGLLEILDARGALPRVAEGLPPDSPRDGVETALIEPDDDTGNRGLFDELDNVFDNAVTAEEIDAELFAGDIEEMLSAIGTIPEPAVRSTPDPVGVVSEKDPISEPETRGIIVGVEENGGDAYLEIYDEAEARRPMMNADVSAEVPENVPAEEPANVPAEEPAGGTADNDHETVGMEPGPARDESGSVHYDYTGEKIVKQSLRVDTRKIDSLMNQVGELVVSRASYSQLSAEMRELEHLLKGISGLDAKDFKRVRNLSFRIGEATVALGRVANDLQEGVMKVRMLPIAQLFNRYPRLVRDLVQGADKKVNLEMRGEETELDKMVIEQIADPMIHIIRNAVDHGIETAAERRAKGKPEEASLTLESYHESNHVVVEITDDGRGINPELVKKVALDRKFATAEEVERLNYREIISFIMRPGFSTVSEVTTTSGRGVGMDVVKKNIEKLNGTIEIDSAVDEGTRVRIKIPLTMAIIQALLVRVGQEIFTIPLSAVEETIRTHEDAISMIDGVEVIHLRNATLSLLRLTEIFATQSTAQDLNRPYVVVVNTGMKRVGLVVDALIGQEETVIKPLADYLQENSGFSGATILGDGRISLILDVYELVNLTIKRRKSREYPEDYAQIGGTAEMGTVSMTIH